MPRNWIGGWTPSSRPACIPTSCPIRDSGVLTTGRMESTGQVVFQRGLQLPPLQPGTADVVVNGVDYRVRTIPGGSARRRADFDRHPRRQHPVEPGAHTVLRRGRSGDGVDRRGRRVAVVRARDPAAAPAHRTHPAARQGDRGDAGSARRPRGRGTVRGDDGNAQPAGCRTAGHHRTRCRPRRISRRTPHTSCAPR